MKKYLSLFLVFLMTLFCFSGCGSQQNTSEIASSAAETAASMVTKSDLTNTAKLKIKLSQQSFLNMIGSNLSLAIRLKMLN